MLSSISGISRGSRPILRTQPQLRLDCSAPSTPFSQRTTDTPRSARNSAVLTPAIPPPITTTSADAGKVASVAQASIGGPEWLSPGAVESRSCFTVHLVALPHSYPAGDVGTSMEGRRPATAGLWLESRCGQQYP